MHILYIYIVCRCSGHSPDNEGDKRCVWLPGDPELGNKGCWPPDSAEDPHRQSSADGEKGQQQGSHPWQADRHSQQGPQEEAHRT